MKESRGSLCQSCYQPNFPNLTAGLGCVEGWGGDEGARVTCGRFMAEMDTHVLRIVDGIWVSKIVFLIFRICVNNIMLRGTVAVSVVSLILQAMLDIQHYSLNLTLNFEVRKPLSPWQGIIVMETSLKPGFHEWGYANIFVTKIILFSFWVFSIFF